MQPIHIYTAADLSHQAFSNWYRNNLPKTQKTLDTQEDKLRAFVAKMEK